MVEVQYSSVRSAYPIYPPSLSPSAFDFGELFASAKVSSDAPGKPVIGKPMISDTNGPWQEGGKGWHLVLGHTEIKTEK